MQNLSFKGLLGLFCWEDGGCSKILDNSDRFMEYDAHDDSTGFSTLGEIRMMTH